MGRKSSISTNKPEGMKKEEFLCHLIAQGYLSIDENGRLHKHWDREYGKDKYIDKKIDKKNEQGYMIANLNLGGKTTIIRIHRLIWWYYFGEIGENRQINHLDGDKANNRLENIELTTPKGNIQHALNIIKTIKKHWKSKKSIYKKEDYEKFKQLLKSTKKIKEIKKIMNMKHATYYRIKKQIEKGIEDL